jgi:Circularly permutated YpsA SLOG family
VESNNRRMPNIGGVVGLSNSDVGSDETSRRIKRRIRKVCGTSSIIAIPKIVSGGQTGVDRAALDAALTVGFPCGGWCPEDRMAEDGVTPDRYPLMPLPNGGYRRRTRLNVVDSDGAAII